MHFLHVYLRLGSLLPPSAIPESIQIINVNPALPHPVQSFRPRSCEWVTIQNHYGFVFADFLFTDSLLVFFVLAIESTWKRKKMAQDADFGGFLRCPKVQNSIRGRWLTKNWKPKRKDVRLTYVYHLFQLPASCISPNGHWYNVDTLDKD